MDDLAIEVRENKGIYYKVRYAALLVSFGNAKCYAVTSAKFGKLNIKLLTT